MTAIGTINRPIRPGILASTGSISTTPAAAATPRAGADRTDQRQTADRAPTRRSESGSFSSAKLAIAALLGVVTYPPPATLQVNGRTVTVDLSVDSLSSIAARVLAEARTEASVQEEELGGSLRYRLVVDGEVEPVGPADAQVAALVGFARPRPAPLPSPHSAPEADPETSPAPAETAGESPRHEGARTEMLDLFTAIDAAMGRVREQAAPLAMELRELGPDPESN